MNADVKHILILINKADGFLFLPAVHDLFKPVETPHSMVDMRYEITRLKVVDLLKGQGFLAGISFPQVILLVALKDLVIGVEEELKVVVDEAFVDYVNENLGSLAILHRVWGLLRCTQGRLCKLLRFHVFVSRFQILEYCIQPVGLLGTVGKDHIPVPLCCMIPEIGHQQFKILIKRRLGCCIENHLPGCFKVKLPSEFYR